VYLSGMQVFLAILFSVSASYAQELPGTAWQLNPQNQFKEKVGAPKFSGSNGFSKTYESGDLEVQLKGTKIESPIVAQQMTVVEFNNIEKLYSARGNPYEGQITELIECDKTYQPRSTQFQLGTEQRRVLMVGANERRLFGACTKNQISYWASYFNFYDSPSKMVIEIRIFLKAAQPTAKQVGEFSRRLETISKELLVLKAAP
jgi:hypothetical protein